MIVHPAGSRVSIVDDCVGPKPIAGTVGNRKVSDQENLWFKFVPDDKDLSEYFITDDLIAGLAKRRARRISSSVQEAT